MSYTKMLYHIVTATKHRKRIITPRVEEKLFPLMCAVAEKHGGKIIAIGGIPDHVHMAAGVPPKVAVADFVGKVKADSSRLIKRRIPRLDEFKWQRGYGGFSISSFEASRVIEYVLDQKEHHREDTIWEELERVEEQEENEEGWERLLKMADRNTRGPNDHVCLSG